jgi:hypothetical protein
MTSKYSTDDLISMLRNSYGHDLGFREFRLAAADKLEALQRIANVASVLSNAIARSGVDSTAVNESVRALDFLLAGYDK